MNWCELNLDGLVGPTHNYAGLAYGNVASATNQDTVSTPRAAALQGLEKMKAVWQLGIKQAVLPPQLRPSFRALRALGFSGSDQQMIEQAHRASPRLLAACYSASNMWTANAATVSPSVDCADGLLHLTPANLISTLHRAIEAETTYKILSYLFADDHHFAVHPPLPGYAALADEGAANHIRLCGDFGQRGLEVFVYGRDSFNPQASTAKQFPARQSLQASQAIARQHGLDSSVCDFVQQHPAAIDAGVFHNDVVCVGHQNLLLYHAEAFADQPQTIERLRKRFDKVTDAELICIEISSAEISLADAVKNYLLNCQILTKPSGKMCLLCPDDCERFTPAKAWLDNVVAQTNPIDEYLCMDLRQSMMNGGGPACLRLRVVMHQEQLAAMHPAILFDDKLYQALQNWIVKHYRETIAPDDLRDPLLPRETAAAAGELAIILDLPAELLA